MNLYRRYAIQFGIDSDKTIKYQTTYIRGETCSPSSISFPVTVSALGDGTKYVRHVYRMKIIRGMYVHVSVILILGVVGSCWAELRLLLSIFRHGDRYPIGHALTKSMYPLNPHANVSWFPDSDGGLTMEGKRRSFKLGKILREQYGDWLGGIYSPRLFEFRSSSSERTIATSLLVAAGLFPPSDSQRWNPHLDWQPIPVFTIPREEKILYYGPFCSKYLEILKDTVSQDPTIVEYDRNMQQFYDYVSRNTGAPATNRMIYYFYMEHLAARSGGLEAPKWTDGLFPEKKLREAAIMEYIYSSWTPELKRYTGGVWLNKWLEHVSTYIEQDNENYGIKKKAYFYGGHDINIAGIMTTLGIFYPHTPNYASAINFELHQDDDQQFYVKVLHKDSDEFIEQLVPGCDDILCPLKTFKKISTTVEPSNGSLECGTLLF